MPAGHPVKILAGLQHSPNKRPRWRAIRWFKLSDGNVRPERLTILRQWHLKFRRDRTFGDTCVALRRESPTEHRLCERTEIWYEWDSTFFRVECTFRNARPQ